MTNDEKILSILEKQGKTLEALQADVKGLKTDVSDLKKGQVQTNERLSTLEKGQTRLEAGQAQTNKQISQLADDMGEFFNKTWVKMDSESRSEERRVGKECRYRGRPNN